MKFRFKYFSGALAQEFRKLGVDAIDHITNVTEVDLDLNDLEVARKALAAFGCDEGEIQAIMDETVARALKNQEDIDRKQSKKR